MYATTLDFPPQYFAFIGVTEFFNKQFAVFASRFMEADTEPERLDVGNPVADAYEVPNSLRSDIENVSCQRYGVVLRGARETADKNLVLTASSTARHIAENVRRVIPCNQCSAVAAWLAGPVWCTLARRRRQENDMQQDFDGNRPDCVRAAYIAESAEVIGDVTLGEDASVWPQTVIRGDVNAIRIGARTNVQDGCVLHVTHDGPYTPGGFALEIAEDVTVGHGAVLHGCFVGARCLVGIRAIVLDGAALEEEVLLGAGALVPPGKRLESGFLYRGQPARRARALTAEERDALAYSARHYVELARRHGLATPRRTVR